ncbi:delayed-rectifier potassium channel regulatory subunit KCNS3 [Tamandua tetradactyla]|uniref:delayed-rectifier potassium channel regulatory subunit KCNS3 n=1 Tax=Tamandua tetradactyla TaxID=48850 RepID=UPI004054197B
MVFGELFHAGHDGELVHLNVGGFKQSVEQSTLRRFPHTRLGRLLACRSEDAILQLCDDYSAAEREFYFDRNPSLFRYVLNFYYTGRLHVMEELCVFSFRQEIEYWGLSELLIGSCCSGRYQERKEEPRAPGWEQKSDSASSDTSSRDSSLFEKELEKFDKLRFGRLRRKVWVRMENPAHCLSAKLLAAASLGVVLASIVAMCVHSMSEFQNADGEVDDPVLAGVEVACIAWFTGELAVRLAAAPCQRRFWKSPLNIIDVVSVAPFYATLAVAAREEESADLENVGKAVQALRLMRVFRILKLARHSGGLRSLGATLRHSHHEVGLLLLFLSVGIAIFSVLVFSAERDEPGAGLGSIPVCWWWATISMTTVGYGDTHPVTVAGKLVASACILCGILVVALPITIIFNKFSKYYQQQRAAEAGSAGRGSPPPGHNVRDAYAQRVHAFVAGLSAGGVVASEPASPDALSTDGPEDENSPAPLEQRAAHKTEAQLREDSTCMSDLLAEMMHANPCPRATRGRREPNKCPHSEWRMPCTCILEAWFFVLVHKLLMVERDHVSDSGQDVVVLARRENLAEGLPWLRRRLCCPVALHGCAPDSLPCPFRLQARFSEERTPSIPNVPFLLVAPASGGTATPLQIQHMSATGFGVLGAESVERDQEVSGACVESGRCRLTCRPFLSPTGPPIGDRPEAGQGPGALPLGDSAWWVQELPAAGGPARVSPSIPGSQKGLPLARPAGVSAFSVSRELGLISASPSLSAARAQLLVPAAAWAAPPALPDPALTHPGTGTRWRGSQLRPYPVVTPPPLVLGSALPICSSSSHGAGQARTCPDMLCPSFPAMSPDSVVSSCFSLVRCPLPLWLCFSLPSRILSLQALLPSGVLVPFPLQSPGYMCGCRWTELVLVQRPQQTCCCCVLCTGGDHSSVVLTGDRTVPNARARSSA